MRIEIVVIDKLEVGEVPREVAINFAVMKYPDKFDDRKSLKEGV
jgi:hypothetical protein